MTARRLVSSERGAIEAVLYALPGAFLREAPEVADALAIALADGIAATVLTHAGAAAEVRRRMPGGTTVVIAPDYVALSVWIQDQSLAFQGAGERPGLLANERLPIGWLAVDPVDGLVPIDGGNLLVGADYALVGQDELAFWRTGRSDPPPEEEAAALALFAADYGLASRVVPVGWAAPAESPYGRTEWRGEEPWRIDPEPGILAKGSRQAVFHVDVYVTPAGRDAGGRPQVLVGDPGLAAALTGAEPPDPAYDARFDAEAAGLAAAGFTVHRNPLPAIAIEHAHRRRRTRHLLSANNAWVEAVDVPRRRAWVPVFASGPEDPLQAVDDAMMALWRDLGFETVAVPGLGPLALRNGGLNCASRILRRRI